VEDLIDQYETIVAEEMVGEPQNFGDGKVEEESQLVVDTVPL